MIMRFHGVTVRQCAQAQDVFGAPGGFCTAACDGAGNLANTPDCDNPASPNFLGWGFYPTHNPLIGPPPNGSPLWFSVIKTQIDNGRPLCVSWIENLGSTPDPLQPGHMVVISGYDAVYSMLRVLDPQRHAPPDTYWIYYSDYDGTSTAYTHREDWYDIHP
jgi:hypothetical protein